MLVFQVRASLLLPDSLCPWLVGLQALQLPGWLPRPSHCARPPAQVVGFACNLFPTSLDIVGHAGGWAWRRLRGPTPADKFAAAVSAAMAQVGGRGVGWFVMGREGGSTSPLV